MATFSELLKSNKPVLVDFFAEWCGPCKMMAPNLKTAKEGLGDTATIIKVDIDKNPQTAREFNVQSVPTLILVKAGEVKWRQSGVVPAQTLLQVVKQYV